MLLSPPVRKKRVLYIAALCVGVVLFTGCQAVRFYSQAIGGQFEIFQKQRPVANVLADPATDAKLKRKLELVMDMREFARTNLHLDPDGHYIRYADLKRDYVVWNVNATPELSLEPKTWWYPFVGHAKYRGYFSEKAAVAYGEKWRRKGYDVYISGAEAYSTLGWFKDPLLSTFIDNWDPNLAETLFHELAHQRVFAAGDTDFNEAFATVVGEEGARRWINTTGDDSLLQKYRDSSAREEQFVQLVQATRKRLKSLFAESVSDDEKRAKKREIISDMRQRYQELKVQWGGSTGYDKWFSRPLNNAQLNTVAAYFDLVPAFEQMLADVDGDLDKFYAAVEALTKASKEERHQKLKALLAPREKAI